jgi:ribosomal protein S18 acetylase RimI-like enzyme
MLVRRVPLEEWPRLREIRLRALADAPYAFGTTYGDTVHQPEEYWHRMLDDPVWVAEEEDRWVGMVRASEEDGAAHLISMWVEPEARGRGIGRALVEAMVDWARERAVPAVRLWVAEANAAAEALFLSAGFVDTGERQPLPSNPSVSEIGMRLPLR